MSRKPQDDEYTENHKGVELYFEDDGNFENQDDGEADDDYRDRLDEFCEATKLLKEYVSENGLPLCQYLDSELLVEFME